MNDVPLKPGFWLLLICVGVLSPSLLLAEERPPLHIWVDTCVALPADLLSQALAMELNATLHPQVPADTVRPLIKVTCAPKQLNLELWPNTTRKPLQRAIAWEEGTTDFQIRWLVLSTSELLEASKHPTSQNPHTLRMKALAQHNVDTLISDAHAESFTASMHQSPYRLRRPFTAPITPDPESSWSFWLSGGTAGWEGDAPNVPTLGVSLNWSPRSWWGLDFGVVGALTERSTDLGSIQTTLLATRLGTFTQMHHGNATLQTGLGLMVGTALFEGHANDFSITDETSDVRLWTALVGHVAAGWAISSGVNVMVTTEVGVITWPVVALSGDQPGETLDGIWTGLRLGLGWQWEATP